MENTNGVKVAREHCNKCRCRECAQRQKMYGAEKKAYIRCPYGNNVCVGCNKKEYVEDCLFRL